MTNTATPKFRLFITYHATNGRPDSASIQSAKADRREDEVFSTADEARDFVASVPKALGLSGGRRSTFDDAGDYDAGLVSGHVELRSNRSNGGANETGIRRLRRWIADLDVEYAAPYGNSYPTLDEALAAIDAEVAAVA